MRRMAIFSAMLGIVFPTPDFLEIHPINIPSISVNYALPYKFLYGTHVAKLLKRKTGIC